MPPSFSVFCFRHGVEITNRTACSSMVRALLTNGHKESIGDKSPKFSEGCGFESRQATSPMDARPTNSPEPCITASGGLHNANNQKGKTKWQTKKNKIPGSFSDFLETIATGKSHNETPSEKILNLALERDKVYDKLKKIEGEIDKESGTDYVTFLQSQKKQLEQYKKMLGDQIKKLIDET